MEHNVILFHIFFQNLSHQFFSVSWYKKRDILIALLSVVSDFTFFDCLHG